MEVESLTDANNITADAFSHVYSSKRENTNMVFTTEELEKLEKLVGAVNNLTINDAKYNESNTATVNDAQVNLTSNLETVTHTSNGICKQKLLSYQTIPVFTLSTNPKIEVIRLTLQMLLTPATKEICADMMLGGAWMSTTPWQVIRTGVNRSTTGNIGNDIVIVEN